MEAGWVLDCVARSLLFCLVLLGPFEKLFALDLSIAHMFLVSCQSFRVFYSILVSAPASSLYCGYGYLAHTHSPLSAMIVDRF